MSSSSPPAEVIRDFGGTSPTPSELSKLSLRAQTIPLPVSGRLSLENYNSRYCNFVDCLWFLSKFSHVLVFRRDIFAECARDALGAI